MFLARIFALALGFIAFATISSGAFARPLHHKSRKQAAQVERVVTPAVGTNVVAATTGGPREAVAQTGGAGVAAGSSSVVAEARRHIGTNPTGRGSLWCGAFMDLVLKRTGHAGGGNLARAYARYGTRVSGPQIGAIAVMGRRGGGHVGVVSGIDANGNPVIISGNHNRRVAESVYPRGRITAYVMPN